jgi:large subunit ribosomal protein L25
MAKKHTLTTLTLEARSATGTTTAHALRKIGKVPGVVYGHGAPTPVTVDAKQLAELLLSGNRSHIVEATVAGKPDSVLIRKIEAHPLSRKPLAVDFQRVSQGEAISSAVTIVTVGVARGVKDEGAVMDIVSHTLDIKGPAQSIPDHLEIDVSDMGAHTHVSAGDVKLPEGFSLLTPPDTIVVSVEITRAAVSEGPAEETAAALPADAAITS